MIQPPPPVTRPLPPEPPDNLVGRDQETAAAVRLLTSPHVRLLTLTGPGGVGKTRLALRIAIDAAPAFPDGVAVAPLAELRDPALIRSAVSHALGIQGASGRALAVTVEEHLASRRMLLVLDNVEQLLPEATTQVSALIAACPRLTVLATSRTLLRAQGEHAFPVLPLGVPPNAEVAIEELDRYAAVQLLMRRGQALRPDLYLTPENAADIAALCRHLEGLPLALELAAAWLRIFSPAAIRRRVDHRLPFLVGGSVDQPERHLTMRRAIQWSVDLLPPSVEIIFHRLAVFAGGWTLEAAESVVAMGMDASAEVFDGIVTLCDASLVQQIDGLHGEPRFRMLETIREYAWERLVVSGEEGALQRAHAAHFLGIAQQAAKALLGTVHADSFDFLESEHENLRAALEWSMVAEPDWSLRLAANLAAFWGNRGHFAEGQQWYERILDAAQGAAAGSRAAALFGFAWLTWGRGDNDRAEQSATESLELAVTVADVEGVIFAQYLLGRIAGSQGRWALAAERLTKAFVLSRDQKNAFAEAVALHHLGIVAYRTGDWSRARSLLDEAVALNRALRLPVGIAWALNSLSLVMRAQGDFRATWAIYRESLSMLGEGDETYAAIPLAGLARFAAEAGQVVPAIRIVSTLVSRRELIGSPVWEHAGPDLERVQTLVAKRGSQDASELTPSLADAIAEALMLPDPFAPPVANTTAPDALTPREREVLALLATGCSNPDIADTLGIGLTTVKSHVASILGKLGVTTRTAAAHHAIHHGLDGPPSTPHTPLSS